MDRNIAVADGRRNIEQSPPARVAWIETRLLRRSRTARAVATREGGVDRNEYTAHYSITAQDVATREGGVDRNIHPMVGGEIVQGRHPRGWRG